jgi:hypothetical protein
VLGLGAVRVPQRDPAFLRRADDPLLLIPEASAIACRRASDIGPTASSLARSAVGKPSISCLQDFRYYFATLALSHLISAVDSRACRDSEKVENRIKLDVSGQSLIDISVASGHNCARQAS